MRWEIHNRLQSELVRNSARLLSANVLAQVVGLLVYPILTRMYAPEDFGLLNLFMSIGGILLVLSTCGYHDAIVLPKEERKSQALVQLCVGIILCLSILLVFSIPFSPLISSLFKAPELQNWWWLMPVYICGMGMWNVLSNYYIRQKAFARISGYQIFQSLLNAGNKLGLGALGCFSGGLIISSVVAPVISLGTSIAKGRRLLAGLWHVNKNEVCQAAKEYYRFPLYSLPRSLVNILSNNLFVLLLAPVFGLTEIGYYGMALTLAFRPLQLIVQSVYQVFLQRVAQRVNEKRKIRHLFVGYITRAGVIFIPLFAGLWFVLPILTEWLLGNEWRMSGEYIRLMLPWLLLMVLTGPFTFITDIFHLQRPALWVEIGYLCVRLATLVSGIWLHDFRLTLLLYSISSALVCLGQLIWFYFIINRYERTA